MPITPSSSSHSPNGNGNISVSRELAGIKKIKDFRSRVDASIKEAKRDNKKELASDLKSIRKDAQKIENFGMKLENLYRNRAQK